jgi:transcriptional regulator with XRE-family HTH domain
MSARAVRSVRTIFGRRLRRLRQAGGFSQERLGERSNLSGKFLGEVERGTKSISLDSMHHVAVALGAPLTSLIHGVPPMRRR